MTSTPPPPSKQHKGLILSVCNVEFSRCVVMCAVWCSDFRLQDYQDRVCVLCAGDKGMCSTFRQTSTPCPGSRPRHGICTARRTANTLVQATPGGSSIIFLCLCHHLDNGGEGPVPVLVNFVFCVYHGLSINAKQSFNMTVVSHSRPPYITFLHCLWETCTPLPLPQVPHGPIVCHQRHPWSLSPVPCGLLECLSWARQVCDGTDALQSTLVGWSSKHISLWVVRSCTLELQKV